MSVVESIVDAIGSPVGIRCTAYGYFDGETVPSGNTSREGLQVTDQSHTVIHHYVINDDVLKASKDEQDQLLDNALRKCLHTHYDRHVRSFLSKKQYLDLPPEAYPVLFLYETYDSGDPYDGGFAHYQGQPTLPEGLTSQTIQPGEHNIIVPDKTSVKQCKEEAIQHVSNEVASLPRSLDAIQHLYDKPPETIQSQLETIVTRPENQLIYEAINKPVPSLPTIEGIRCAKDTLEALQDLITPYYRVSRAYQSFKDTFHNALYDWFDDELRRRFNSRS